MIGTAQLCRHSVIEDSSPAAQKLCGRFAICQQTLVVLEEQPG